MIRPGAWVVVIDSGNKYFGCEGEVVKNSANQSWWEVLLFWNDKQIRVDFAPRNLKVIKKELDASVKEELNSFFIKREIDCALDKKDKEKFYELTQQLKVLQ